MLRFLLATVVCLSLLVGCDFDQSSNRSGIEFVGPSDTWASQADEYETAEVYAAYKEQISGPPPPSSPLAETLGKRGDAALDLLVADISSGDRAILYGYSHVLLEMRRLGAEDFCANEDSKSKLLEAFRSAASREPLWRPYSYHRGHLAQICS